ncbi:hypothetical protein [Streptomyces sp. URMC 129]|uniref:hypothetical protein n=1 Tax=Streptomyces sp. URMC 129 TaxID=3423407 RepID=UPI003F1CBE8C
MTGVQIRVAHVPLDERPHAQQQGPPVGLRRQAAARPQLVGEQRGHQIGHHRAQARAVGRDAGAGVRGRPGQQPRRQRSDAGPTRQRPACDTMAAPDAPTSRLFLTLIAEAVAPGSPLHGHYAELHGALRSPVRAWPDPAALPPGLDPDALAVVLLGTLIGIHQQGRIAPDAVDLDRVYATWRAVPAPAPGITTDRPPAKPAVMRAFTIANFKGAPATADAARLPVPGGLESGSSSTAARLFHPGEAGYPL